MFASHITSSISYFHCHQVWPDFPQIWKFSTICPSIFSIMKYIGINKSNIPINSLPVFFPFILIFEKSHQVFLNTHLLHVSKHKFEQWPMKEKPNFLKEAFWYDFPKIWTQKFLVTLTATQKWIWNTWWMSEWTLLPKIFLKKKGLMKILTDDSNVIKVKTKNYLQTPTQKCC